MSSNDNIIKESFRKVREDMEQIRSKLNTVDSIKEEVLEVKNFNTHLRTELLSLCSILKDLSQKVDGISPKKHQSIDAPIERNFSYLPFPQPQIVPIQYPQVLPILTYRPQSTSTHIGQNSTVSTHSSTDNLPLENINSVNLGISTGNRGVPTDKQTDKQTDQQTDIPPKIEISSVSNPIKNASEILASLDSIKKEIRLKFKRLTDQEFLVFSTLYQLQNEGMEVDYKLLAHKLELSESSIRDYVGRIINKGIPVDKKKINNKSIVLNISPDLTKIASLPTLYQLRDI